MCGQTKQVQAVTPAAASAVALKVGDKVRVIKQSFSRVPVGSIGTVLKVYPNGGATAFFKEAPNYGHDDQGWTHFRKELELVTEEAPATPTFTKGDHVIALADSQSTIGNVYYRNGDRGIVTEVADEGNSIKVNFDGFCGNTSGLVPADEGLGGGWWIAAKDLKQRWTK